jgi:hypothetical protein
MNNVEMYIERNMKNSELNPVDATGFTVEEYMTWIKEVHKDREKIVRISKSDEDIYIFYDMDEDGREDRSVEIYFRNNIVFLVDDINFYD